MITLEEKITRIERLLRRLEEDEPYLRVRLSPLGAEHRQSASAFAGRVRAEAQAELNRLLAERESTPEANMSAAPSEDQGSPPRDASGLNSLRPAV